jgi:hypothetical protein
MKHEHVDSQRWTIHCSFNDMQMTEKYKEVIMSMN